MENVDREKAEGVSFECLGGGVGVYHFFGGEKRVFKEMKEIEIYPFVFEELFRVVEPAEVEGVWKGRIECRVEGESVELEAVFGGDLYELPDVEMRVVEDMGLKGVLGRCLDRCLDFLRRRIY